MLELGVKLLLAHVLGDFVFQPNSWIKEKEHKLHKSIFLYVHIGVHVLVMMVLLQFQMKYMWGIVFIAVSHFLIDLGKIKFQNEDTRIGWFLMDQFLHLLVILLVLNHFEGIGTWDGHVTSQVYLLVTAVVLVTQVAGIFIRVLLSKWKMAGDLDSPNSAGKYIGMLERLFILSFVLLNYWEGIGFLLAAKSVFRFGDLNNAKDRDLTEYVLIGTLLSFGIGLAIAGGLKFALNSL
jgi:hypothetical protein